MSQSFETTVKKDNYIKELIKKQLHLSDILCWRYPYNDTLRTHLALLLNIYNSNFHRILATRLKSEVTIHQFSQIYVKALLLVCSVFMIQ